METYRSSTSILTCSCTSTIRNNGEQWDSKALFSWREHHSVNGSFLKGTENWIFGDWILFVPLQLKTPRKLIERYPETGFVIELDTTNLREKNCRFRRDRYDDFSSWHSKNGFFLEVLSWKVGYSTGDILIGREASGFPRLPPWAAWTRVTSLVVVKKGRNVLTVDRVLSRSRFDEAAATSSSVGRDDCTRTVFERDSLYREFSRLNSCFYSIPFRNELCFKTVFVATSVP